jgi:type IV pilus biogenesis protein CpaD/CtpE
MSGSVDMNMVVSVPMTVAEWDRVINLLMDAGTYRQTSYLINKLTGLVQHHASHSAEVHQLRAVDGSQTPQGVLPLDAPA